MRPKRQFYGAYLFYWLPVVLSIYLPYHTSIGLSFERKDVHASDLFPEKHKCISGVESNNKQGCIQLKNVHSFLATRSYADTALKKTLLSLVTHRGNIIFGAWGNSAQFESFVGSFTEYVAGKHTEIIHAWNESDFQFIESELRAMISGSSCRCVIINIYNVVGIPSWFQPLLKSITDQNVFEGEFLPFQVIILIHLPRSTPVSTSEAFHLASQIPTLQHRVVHLMKHISLCSV